MSSKRSGADRRERPALETAARVGFLGDAHGDLQFLLDASHAFGVHGVEVIVVCGDFGMVWPRPGWRQTLAWFDQTLTEQGQLLLFIDGNHEDFTALYQYPVGDDGLRWIGGRIAHLPRGYRTTLASGRTLAVLGGANSVDYEHRFAGISWWEEESITDHDLTALGDERADILVGHDAPLGVPPLESLLERTDKYWAVPARQYSAEGRAMFHRGFLQVRPALYLGGHYHHHVDETRTFTNGGTSFRSRVVTLNQNGQVGPGNAAIVDMDTLEVELMPDASAQA